MAVQTPKKHLFFLFVSTVILVFPSLVWASSIEKAHRLLDQWEFERASSVISTLKTSGDDGRAVDILKARHAFLTGEYERAHRRIEKLDVSSERVQKLKQLIEASYSLTKDYTEVKPEGSRFTFLIEDERDRVLIPYAKEALEAAYERLGDILDHKPSGRIRVEIYPSEKKLAKISGLTAEDIRNSGTIALCKFNRLMITSPRALLRGYPWVDTLIHEYVHFVVNRRNQNNVPIWMHEGVAKYLERQWRGSDQSRLSPRSGHLLRTRLAEDDLITFEQMHPSIAKLPTQEDATLAFAQVYTMMEYLAERHSMEIFSRMLDAINQGVSPKGAIAEVTDMPFDNFEREWRQHLENREYKPYPEESSYSQALIFESKGSDRANKTSEGIEDTKASEHIKLGRQLRAKNRCRAAIVQYRKAKRRIDYTDHRLNTDMAKCYRTLQKYDKAVERLEPVVDKYPKYVFGWIEMGKSKVLSGDAESALDYLNEAARLNPFDPDVFQYLKKAYDSVGRADKKEQAEQFFELVGGSH